MSDSDDPGDAKRTAETVLRRDRRRIRSLAVLTIGLWVIAGLLIPSVYLPLGAKMKHYAQVLAADNPGAADRILSDRAIEPAPPPVPPQDVPQTLAKVQHQQWVLSELVVHEWIIGAIILAFALAAGILASASTVALALTIRRTTLRQVSASLAEISDQLRLLRAQGGGGG